MCVPGGGPCLSTGTLLQWGKQTLNLRAWAALCLGPHKGTRDWVAAVLSFGWPALIDFLKTEHFYPLTMPHWWWALGLDLEQAPCSFLSLFFLFREDLAIGGRERLLLDFICLSEPQWGSAKLNHYLNKDPAVLNPLPFFPRRPTLHYNWCRLPF